MPNTKSAERRVRRNDRRHDINHRTLTRLKTLEKKYRDAVKKSAKDAAAAALREVISAFDKAAKSGAIPKARADRKKSRLTLALAAVK
ncbi:MAG: 30S ribosomal protein S20 [Rhodobacteraceae bacterium]|nr:30S ribosomal protein S20 [Paracoccaceae bacterium]